MLAWLGGVDGSGPGSTIAVVVAWYMAMWLMTAAGLAPAVALFPHLASRGIHLARPIGLAVVALVTWLAVHLTPLPYGSVAVSLSLVAVAGTGTGVVLWRRGWPGYRRILGERWREFTLVEALAAVAFVVLVLVRMQTPDAWGTEKPADLMMLTAVHRATDLPPLDPWAAGETISYYHLGHLQADHLARLAGVGPDVAFNLAVATVGAIALAAVAGLAMDVVRMDAAGSARRVRRGVLWLAGGVAAAGVLLVTPVAGVVQVLAANGLGRSAWERLGVEGIPPDGGATALVPDAFWWWWPTTRVVPGVISEYPAFSLLLGDPHPHLLALSLGVAALGLGVQAFSGATPLSWRRWFVRPDQLLLTALLFAALAMTNSWDVLSYGVIWAGAAWWSAVRVGWPAPAALLVVTRWGLAPAILGGVLAYPFLSSLDPAPLGVSFVRGESSDLPRWLLFWLPVLLPGVVSAMILTRPGRIDRGSQVPLVVMLGLLAWLPVGWVVAMIASGHAGEVMARGGGWGTTILLVGGGAVLAVAAWRTGREARAADRRAWEAGCWLLAATAALFLVTEFVHIDDQFAGRLNTTFKYWFHAWVMAAVAGGSLVALSVDRWLDARTSIGARIGPGPLATATLAVCATLWLASTMIPAFIAVSRARESQAARLSATAFLADRADGFAAAVAWGQGALEPSRHVVVESVGESFGEGSHFSAFTAIPTILGWAGHELQWRADLHLAERQSAVDAIYTGDPSARAAAVAEWGVTHVLVGPREQAIYGGDLTLLEAEWPVAFSAGDIEVLAVPTDLLRPSAGRVR